jgi:hypothetical protein
MSHGIVPVGIIQLKYAIQIRIEYNRQSASPENTVFDKYSFKQLHAGYEYLIISLELNLYVFCYILSVILNK